MKKAYSEKYPYNAETTIDYKAKSVSFNYTQDINKKNTWKAYEYHIVSLILGSIVGVMMFFLFFLPLTVSGLLYLNYYNLLNIFTFILTLVLIIVMYKISGIIGIKALGGISIILHENIKYLRDIFPKSNAILHMIFRKFKKKKIIDFEKIDDIHIRKDLIFIKNNLVMKYNIVVFEYELTGDCSKYIKKVYTKCYEDGEKRKDPLVTKFKIIFEFSKKPKKGKVIVW